MLRHGYKQEQYLLLFHLTQDKQSLHLNFKWSHCKPQLFIGKPERLTLTQTRS